MLSDNIYYVSSVHKVYGLMQGDLPGDSPRRGKVGSPTKEQEKNSNCSIHNYSSSGLLSRLKRDRPELAQQVINGDMSATRAAREE